MPGGSLFVFWPLNTEGQPCESKKIIIQSNAGGFIGSGFCLNAV